MIDINNPSQRQVLVNLGSRWVVFGPEPGFPQKLQFDPVQDSDFLSQAEDESVIAGQRITQTLKVYGLSRIAAIDRKDLGADIVLSDNRGNQVFVDIKVRESSPKSRDYGIGTERIRAASSMDKQLEIWYFNIERLGLIVQTYKDNTLQFYDLPVVDVWSKSENSVLRREHIVRQVELWEESLKMLFSQIKEWLEDRNDLTIDLQRTVPMSEELMQKFSVMDRELPVMDILLGDQVVASVIPHGLWVIGALGRVDLITARETVLLFRLKGEENTCVWKYASPGNRRSVHPFTDAALQEILALE